LLSQTAEIEQAKEVVADLEKQNKHLEENQNEN
jgi:hypothetical protein